MLTVENVTQDIAAWALDYGIPTKLIRSRLKRGWGEERAVTEPMVVWRGEKLPDDAMIDVPPPSPKPVPLSPPRPVTVAPLINRDRKFRFGRRARPVTFNGVTLTASEWASHLGISPQAMHLRLKTKPLEEALTPPPAWRLGW